MTEEVQTPKKAAAKAKTIDDEILAIQEKLRKLKIKKAEQDKKAREKNQKQVLELISSEGLDGVSFEKWKAAVPKLKELLGAESAPAVASVDAQ